MAIGVFLLPLLEAEIIDPAAVAYIRHLVESLVHLTFDEACMLQLTGDDDAASDLFVLHRPPVLTGATLDVASALDTLEEILSRGSPTLAAYQRQGIRRMMALQQQKVRAAMAEFDAVHEVFGDNMDVLEGIRARLYVARATKLQLSDQIAAAQAAAADGGEEAAVTPSLLQELREAEEREAAMGPAFLRLWPSVVVLRKHHLIARTRVQNAGDKLMAIPELPGHLEDEHLVGDAAERYIDSVLVLHDFLALLD